MKNISRLLVFLLPALLLLPQVDSVFSATMPRKALFEPLLLLLCGRIASRLDWQRASASFAPSAVVVATSLLLFWMIPRSIDMTQIYPGVNALYVGGLFAAGFLLSQYFPLLPGVARAAYALYFSGMIVAFGLLYASQSALFCSAYTLDDQHAFGWMVVAVGVASYFVSIGSMTSWLVGPSGSR